MSSSLAPLMPDYIQFPKGQLLTPVQLQRYKDENMKIFVRNGMLDLRVFADRAAAARAILLNQIMIEVDADVTLHLAANDYICQWRELGAKKYSLAVLVEVLKKAFPPKQKPEIAAPRNALHLEAAKLAEQMNDENEEKTYTKGQVI